MFRQLQITDLRLIASAIMQPQPGLNLITGPNGSGKTSILEALYIVTHGRSFRYRDAAPLIRAGSEAYRVVARFASHLGTTHTLGIQRARHDMQVRLDGRPLNRRSDILNLLPVLCLDSDVQSLITGGPEQRRNFLDAGLFHMEPQYLACFQRYHRALEQRNAALKQSVAELAEWEAILHTQAGYLDQWRAQYLAQLLPLMQAYQQQWEVDLALTLQYQRGWSPELSLREALVKVRATDRKMKYTSVGPHRAEIIIRSQEAKGAKRLSRGQLKMAAAALYFAQAKLFQTQQHKSSILLFDDLTAELDQRNQACLLDTVPTLFPQSFITALNATDILSCCSHVADLFHMEQGQLVTK